MAAKPNMESHSWGLVGGSYAGAAHGFSCHTEEILLSFKRDSTFLKNKLFI
jgi:hypothetical protein